MRDRSGRPPARRRGPRRSGALAARSVEEGRAADSGAGARGQSPEPVLLGNRLAALETLDAVAERIRPDTAADSVASRTNAVPGEGNPQARLMLVGEGPGATEDATGRPFVGQAGQLLDSILEAIEVPREIGVHHQYREVPSAPKSKALAR